MINGRLIGTIQARGSLSALLTATGQLQGEVAVPSLILSRDYEELTHKPMINSVELIGDKSFDDLGLSGLTNMEIEFLLR